MMSLLETGVKFHVVSSRQVCDALLCSDHLRYDKTDFWVAALKLVRKIIGILDKTFQVFKKSEKKTKRTLYRFKTSASYFIMGRNLHIEASTGVQSNLEVQQTQLFSVDLLVLTCSN
jgi:hypothetical protein